MKRMTMAVERPSLEKALLVAGAVIATSGLAAAVALLGATGPSALLTLSDVGLALGVGILVFGRSGIVGPTLLARGSLLLFGVGPLVYGFEPAPTSLSVLIGTLTVAVVTTATIATAVLVARTARVHGVARWALLLVAADALLAALMSAVPAEGLVLFYLEVHLELVRPLALLIWGAALALQSPAIRRGVAAAIADWKRTTDFGGASQIDLVDAAPGSKYVQDHAD